ncbi:Ran-binding protein in the microtubule-organising centre protein [Rhizoctonia solani 123E]|uniref:Ran-binding protein in the microtubule-organising centre protein n=1 Tax=Rhizoctonia solani 123E TaxID=1423351 RepID=A0A074S7V9_9AGAM|nr:Ran-binding protein in the microtubule-organising centre protein [Rhizoctonia solani 123E]
MGFSPTRWDQTVVFVKATSATKRGSGTGAYNSPALIHARDHPPNPSRPDHEPDTGRGYSAICFGQRAGKGLVLSYLLYHGHKDTARVFAGEIAHRKDAESIERCPLWLPQESSNTFGVDSDLKSSDHEVVSALDHASLPEQDGDNQASNSIKTHRSKEDITSRMDLNAVPESVLVDVEVRRTPTNTSSPASQATPPSRSPTPISTPVKADTPSEKPPQKPDALASTTLETNSQTLEDPKCTHVPTQTSRNPKSLNLGRSVNPAHILFNLRVQQFVEAIRTVPLPPSSKEHDQASLTEPIKVEEVGGIESISPDSVGRNEQNISSSTKSRSEARQRHLFQLASGLYQGIKSLASSADRETYAKEVEQVCSLMLGPSPESSLAAPYLSMSRREAVADQVNSAMLWYVGEAPAPRLQIWSQTAKVVWDQIVATRPTLPRTDDIPADVRMYAKYVIRSTEGEDQAHENMAIPFDFHSLAQA